MAGNQPQISNFLPVLLNMVIDQLISNKLLIENDFQVITRERKNETLEMTASGMSLYPATKVKQNFGIHITVQKVRENYEPSKFDWNEIRSVTNSGNKVTIKFNDKHKASKIVKTDRAKQAEEIVKLAKVCRIFCKDFNGLILQVLWSNRIEAQRPNNQKDSSFK